MFLFLVHPTGSVLEQSVREDRRELKFETFTL